MSDIKVEIREYRGILFMDTVNDVSHEVVNRFGQTEKKFTLRDTTKHVAISDEARSLIKTWSVADNDYQGSLLWRKVDGIYVLEWYGNQGTMFVPWGEGFMQGTLIDDDAFCEKCDNTADWDRKHYGDFAWKQYKQE